MRLTIKTFASLREQLGAAQETLELDTAEVTIAGLLEILAARDTRWAEALRQRQPIRAAVDLQLVDRAYVVRGDSEIAFFPPVTGG